MLENKYLTNLVGLFRLWVGNLCLKVIKRAENLAQLPLFIKKPIQDRFMQAWKDLKYLIWQEEQLWGCKNKLLLKINNHQVHNLCLVQTLFWKIHKEFWEEYSLVSKRETLLQILLSPKLDWV